MTAPIEFEDAQGRQYERTALAWQRTALAAVVVGLFMVRETDAGAERWLAGAGIAVGLIVVLAAMHRRTTVLRERPAVVAPARTSVVLVFGSLVVFAVAAVWVAL
jgi:hypothetical protein